MGRPTVWGTAEEIDHLKQLMNGRLDGSTKYKSTPEERLRNYIDNAELRIRNDTFGGVDGRRVQKYAEGMLRRLIT